MSLKSRLLGMAFASADVLFELDQTRVAFALGAGPTPGIDPGAAWGGKPLETLLDEPSRATAMAALAALAPGRRSEPFEIRMLTGDGRARRGVLRAFILPELAPCISCALVWEGPVVDVSAPVKARPLLDARGLLRKLAEMMAQGGTGPELAVAFVEVPGLDADDDPHRRAGARIEAQLQAASRDGESAARLSSDRFALMRDASDVTDLAAIVRAAGEAEGLSLSPIATGDLGAAEPAIAVRTLRLALESCLKDGVEAGANFGERLKRTVQDADRFRGIVRDRQFTLAYQPIVALDTRAVHHFEALARFGAATQAPIAPIAMAEELGLIGGFDLAVVEKALLQMRQAGFGLTKIAVNASGLSLTSDAYVEGLLRMTASSLDLRRRLMVEVTETAAIADLDGANRRLKALRTAGIKVCLDDFGAGSASFDYLRKLEVDVVKLDGAFVRELCTEDRARTLAGHLIRLCADLKVATVAEMVETEEQAAAVKALKVDFGQGWLFGRPAPSPVLQAAPSASTRRVGEVVGWG